MAPGEKSEVFKKVWVDVAPHERTVWKCLDKPEKPAKKAKKAKKAKAAKPAKAKKSKPAKETAKDNFIEALGLQPAKEKPAKAAKAAKPGKKKAKKSKAAKPAKPKKTKKSKPTKKPKAKGNAPIKIRMPTWFKKNMPVQVPSFPVKTGPIKHAEDYTLQQPNI